MKSSFQQIVRVRRGFTLTEVLVVVAIIAVLASIGIVVGRKAFGTANATRLRAQLQTIEMGLEAYKSDFGSYPITTATTLTNDEINKAGERGARLLCKALIAPTPQGTPQTNPTSRDQDGADGPGFRVPPRSGVFKLNATDPTKLEGKVYGPYLSGGGLKYGKLQPMDPSNHRILAIGESDRNYDDTTVLADGNGNVILYYPVLSTTVTPGNADTYVGPGTTASPSMFRYTDNDVLYANRDPNFSDEQLTELRSLLAKAGNPKGKYLLISAGQDEFFSVNHGDKTRSLEEKRRAIDDVTNLPN